MCYFTPLRGHLLLEGGLAGQAEAVDEALTFAVIVEVVLADVLVAVPAARVEPRTRAWTKRNSCIGKISAW